MQITVAHQEDQSEAPPMRSGWWLVPSILTGATIWGMVIAALAG